MVSVQDRSVVLETINRSGCAQCSAKSTCGQSTLGRWMETSNQLVIPRPAEMLQPGDIVEISLNGDLLAKAALVVYLLPLLFLLLGTTLAFQIGGTDLSAFSGAAIGLLFGLFLVSRSTRLWSGSASFTPVFHQIITAKSLN